MGWDYNKGPKREMPQWLKDRMNNGPKTRASSEMGRWSYDPPAGEDDYEDYAGDEHWEDEVPDYWWADWPELEHERQYEAIVQ